MHYRRPNTDTRLSPYAPYRIYVAESVAGITKAHYLNENTNWWPMITFVFSKRPQTNLLPATLT